MNKKNSIAIFGFGTVGSAVAHILQTEIDTVEISHIALRNLSELDSKQTASFDASIFTDNHDVIWENSSVDTIVELIGGTGIAKTVIEKALKAKKNVVTANKAVMAEFGNELIDLAQQNNVHLFYEASVAGGIPIIETLKQHVSFGEITKIEGILNGTCNYILSEMEKGGKDFTEVLSEAQKLGFAEADPTADIEGFDVVAKVSILAHFAFHVPFPDQSQIIRKGITHLTEQDFIDAKKESKSIRLLGTLEKQTDGRLALSVSPKKVSQDSLFSSTVGADNLIIIHHNYLGTLTLKGAGAGGNPTAVSVVADILKTL